MALPWSVAMGAVSTPATGVSGPPASFAAGQAAKPPSGGAPSDIPPAGPTADWDLSWRGWDGLHYTVYGQHPAGWAWTRGEKAPPFPSLFLDRVEATGKVGGRVDLDVAFFVNGGGMAPVADQIDLRRWRFFTRGDMTLLVPFSYSLSVMAVDNNRFVLDDIFLEFQRIPYLGTLRVGSFTPAMSLEASGSSRDSTFMEWGTPIQALAPRISAGVQVGQPVFGNRATWTVGQFGQSAGTDVGDATRNFYRIIARGTWLPIDEAPAGNSGSERLLHLGMDLNYLRSGAADIRYRSRPEAYAAPFLTDTGFIAAENMESFGLEAAWVNGPWSIQSEYLHNFVSDTVDGNFYGCYVYGSYFLTGESRAYDRSRGVFGRLRPHRNLSFDGENWGAFETGLRFSYLDLNDGSVRGGIMRNMTAGMNWYFHPNSKLRFNYVYSRADGGPREGNLHIFESRFEFDF